MDRVVMWYGLCAVVGAASSWSDGLLTTGAIIAVLVVFGLVLANAGDQPQTLPIDHAIFGLAVGLAVSRILPLTFLVLEPRG